MIQPISHTFATENPAPPPTGSAQQMPPDTLSPAKETENTDKGLVEFLLDIFLAAWDWLQENYLFCCFDLNEETRERLTVELDAFFNTNFISDKIDEKKLRKGFNALDPILQKKIRSGIIDTLRKHKVPELFSYNKKISKKKIDETLIDWFLFQVPLDNLKQGTEKLALKAGQNVNTEPLSDDLLVLITVINNLEKELQEYENL